MNTTTVPFPKISRSALLAGSFAIACALVGTLASARGADAGFRARLALRVDDSPIARGGPEPASFAEVVSRVSPSVVKIVTQARDQRESTEGAAPFGSDDPLLRQFFGGRAPELRHGPESGLGSGVIISTDGYIVTNNHVVDGADMLTVTLSDGREFPAKVVGRDPLTDIAVVKIDATGLPAITFTDSGKTQVGDRVLAIGNPFGIGETVTSGIVSATGRQVGILADVKGYENFILTDAAINPGNSGGALVDIDGRLVGINTAILSHSGGFQGVGLAVPADMVGQVTGELVEHGAVLRGYLGVNIQNITPALADSFGLQSRDGALVAEVLPNGPAGKAGVESGDVITAINGAKVIDTNKVQMAIADLAPGSKIGLDILRNGQVMHLAATVAERPDPSGAASVASDRDQGVLNGVAVGDLDQDTRQQASVPQNIEGAVITNVDPDSAAARAGLQPGDVILEINRQRVHNAQDAVDLSAKAASKKTLLKLWTRGSTVFVVVDETGSQKSAS
jgi:serine protease Do